MFNALKERLIGCFYTIFTPFDEQENIDFEALEKYITCLHHQGARCFYVMAYNSRYSQLSDSEIFDLNGFCIRTVKALDRDSIIIVGDPIHCSTRTTIEFAKHAKEAGADLVSLIVREKYFDNEQIIEHYATVGREAHMPILVHEMPFLSGYDGKQMHWPPTLLKDLRSIPEIVAIKEDAKDYAITCQALALEPEIRIIIAGTKSSFIQYKKHGARAYLNGISMIDARIGALFWKAYEQDDYVTIDFITKKLEQPFFEKCATRYGWHRTNKALLQAAGLMNRRDRMPLKQLSDDEYKLIEHTYQEIITAWSEQLETLS